MDRYMIIVARGRPNWFALLRSRYGHEAPVILDRRQTPRPTPPTSGLCHTNLERDGYIVVPIK
jgi:hypothetical protein